jgi:tetratricopeptide (TPR) repeat protein
MARLFPLLDEAAALFVSRRYRQAIPLLERILKDDLHNLDAALRLATCYSSLGREQQALAAFMKAEAIAPDSQDVRTYLALHYGRGKDWRKAIPLLESVIAEVPDRLPALEALAVLRERERRIEDAVRLRERIYAMRDATSAELVRLGEMQMSLEQTNAAIASFEKARAKQGAAFDRDLELGVLYLTEGRLQESKDSLDRVPLSSPGYPMALFKRAQVSVLLREPDAPSRIERARQYADPATRKLIEREKLFR